jgi:hydroxymethylpyrimidine pyrophosphatase-like HAD family hydrolase
VNDADHNATPGKPANASEESGKAQNDKSKFSWVTGRFHCSLAAVFKELRLQVEEDVKTRNGLRLANAPYEFSIADSDGAFTVTLQGKGVQKSVVFKLAEHSILVRDDKGETKFEIHLAYSDDGQCRLRVNQKEREYWQVRRMALEDLMFASY